MALALALALVWVRVFVGVWFNNKFGFKNRKIGAVRLVLFGDWRLRNAVEGTIV